MPIAFLKGSYEKNNLHKFGYYTSKRHVRSIKKRARIGCCLGDLLGMKSYTVIYGDYFMVPMTFPDPGTLSNQDDSMEFVRPFFLRHRKTYSFRYINQL